MKSNCLFFVLYLFSYYQLCPAIDFVVAKEVQVNKSALTSAPTSEVEANKSALASAPSSELREKRWVAPFVIAIAAGLISGTISRLLGDQISKLINGHRLRRAAKNMGLIDQRLNFNFDNAVALKKKITALNPAVGAAIMVSKQGFKCAAAFCAGKPKGPYALGLCSKFSCLCDAGKFKPSECAKGLVYDPATKNCNNPKKMPICGF